MTPPAQESSEPKRSKTLALATLLWKRYKALLILDKILTTALLLATVWFIGNRILMVLTTGGYVMPHSADDWAAWGTWIGGLATAAAFMYTAFQLRDQRAYRAADDARRLAALKASAKLVDVDMTRATDSNTLVGIPTYDQYETTAFEGSIHVVKITNDSDAHISNVVIDFNRSWSLPPSAGSPRPVWTDGIGQGITIPLNYDVPSAFRNFRSIPNPSGDGRAIQCENVLADISQECDLAFESHSQDPKVISIKFTDASGFRWHRNKITDELAHIPS